MSAGEQLTAALWAWLMADPALAELVVFDAPPVRAGVPFAVIEEPVLEARDLAGMAGRTGSVAVQIADEGERPTRLRGLVGLIEERLAAMPSDLGGGGWRLAVLSLSKSRMARTKAGWLARSEWLVRVYRADS